MEVHSNVFFFFLYLEALHEFIVKPLHILFARYNPQLPEVKYLINFLSFFENAPLTHMYLHINKQNKLVFKVV